jgi:uncharacterized protein with HEPN domain
MSSSDERVFLAHILIYARRAHDGLDGVALERFLSDVTLSDATIHQLMVMGEAARRLSDASRARIPTMNFSSLIGLRNVIAHGYEKVDLVQIYSHVKGSVPGTIKSVEAALATWGE